MYSTYQGSIAIVCYSVDTIKHNFSKIETLDIFIITTYHLILQDKNVPDNLRYLASSRFDSLAADQAPAENKVRISFLFYENDKFYSLTIFGREKDEFRAETSFAQKPFILKDKEEERIMV